MSYLFDTNVIIYYFNGLSPDGHPNSPSCGHLKIPHLDGVTVTNW